MKLFLVAIIFKIIKHCGCENEGGSNYYYSDDYSDFTANTGTFDIKLWPQRIWKGNKIYLVRKTQLPWEMIKIMMQ